MYGNREKLKLKKRRRGTSMGEVILLELQPGERDRADELAELAKSIWTEHYTPIIGLAQVNYMLDKFQSAGRILADICESGYRYFIAYDGEKQVGYCGISRL